MTNEELAARLAEIREAAARLHEVAREPDTEPEGGDQHDIGPEHRNPTDVATGESRYRKGPGSGADKYKRGSSEVVPKITRYEGTPEAKAIWTAVDRVAERAPQKVKCRIRETEVTPTEEVDAREPDTEPDFDWVAIPHHKRECGVALIWHEEGWAILPLPEANTTEEE